MKSKPQKSPAPRPPIPAPGQGKRGPDGHIAYLLRQANAALRNHIESAFIPFRITLPQFSILTMLNAYPGISNADLARLTFLTPQTVNLIVKNLQKSHALSKTPDPLHGRILRLSLTPKGRSLLANCRKLTQKIESQMLTPLTPSEEKTIRLWLSTLATRWNP